MIRYKDIHKAFDIPVLQGVDLTVETGEMFALFGPSGVGKSVLLKTTLSLIVPDYGDVEIAGAWFPLATGQNDIGENGDEGELGFVQSAVPEILSRRV